MEPIYEDLTEEQRDLALEYAASGGLPIETHTAGDDTVRFTVRLLPADTGGPGWTGEAIAGLEKVLGLGA